MNLHPVERAFEIARAGACRSRSEIARAMEREGYTMADVNQLEGTALTRQLNDLCKQARLQLQHNVDGPREALAH